MDETISEKETKLWCSKSETVLNSTISNNPNVLRILIEHNDLNVCRNDCFPKCHIRVEFDNVPIRFQVETFSFF